MATVKIYGYKGEITAKPFQVNSVESDPEPIGEEKQIVNFLASDPDNQEESQVGENTGN